MHVTLILHYVQVIQQDYVHRLLEDTTRKTWSWSHCTLDCILTFCVQQDMN